jgi:SAM-dependent methyltransferase
MDAQFELQTHRAEDRHWWYRGRRHVLDQVIEQLQIGPSPRILDAGCGSGRNMVDLGRFGQVTGIELSEASVTVARERDAGEVLEGSVMDMPFASDSFDMAVCLDVIEHLSNDRDALIELRRVVRPGGLLLVTVPAYQWLWSHHDEVNYHHRRYNRRSLLDATSAAGWQCLRTTHFNSLLLPVAIVLRGLDRLTPSATNSSLDLWVPPAPLNRLLEVPLRLEASLVARGVRIPAGLSLLGVFVSR